MNEICIKIKPVNGNVFFDLYSPQERILITDFNGLSKGFFDGKTIDMVLLRERRNKVQILSIKDLNKAFDDFIFAIVEGLNSTPIPFQIRNLKKGFDGFIPVESYIDFQISGYEKELVKNQLIFDVLYDKYRNETPKISVYEYAQYMAELLCDDIDKETATNSIYKKLKRATKEHSDRMKYSSLRDQLLEMGIAPEKYDDFFDFNSRNAFRKKGPKQFWDCLYLNCNLLTYRQYRRKLTRENRNYSYDDFLNELYDYNDFVKRLLPEENESPKKYFEKSMTYYTVENYKRIDYIFKIILSISESEIKHIDKNHFLVKRFHPRVLLPHVENEKLVFATRINYYRPLLMLEEYLLKRMQKESDISGCAISLFNCQIIRAKAYELFNYHAEFVSSDYKDIKNFIFHHYNMQSYHEKNEIWRMLENALLESSKDTNHSKAKRLHLKNLDRETAQQLKTLTNSFIDVNKAFFWESPDREFDKPQDN